MHRKNGTRKHGSKRRPATDVSAVRELFARSTILAIPAQPRALISDWEKQRQSADIDALVLAWIASHVSGALHRGRLN